MENLIVVDDQEEADMNLDTVDLVICIGNYSLIKVPFFWGRVKICLNLPRVERGVALTYPAQNSLNLVMRSSKSFLDYTVFTAI